MVSCIPNTSIEFGKYSRVLRESHYYVHLAEFAYLHYHEIIM
jgi:hypothetical protein